MPSHTDPTTTLFAALRAYLAATNPRFGIDELTLKARDGSKVKLRVVLDLFDLAPPAREEEPDPSPEATPPEPPESSDGQLTLSPTERSILRAVAQMDIEEPTGEEIGIEADIRYESHLKKLLSAMRGRGLLGGRKGDTGYPITPLGLAQIEPEN